MTAAAASFLRRWLSWNLRVAASAAVDSAAADFSCCLVGSVKISACVRRHDDYNHDLRLTLVWCDASIPNEPACCRCMPRSAIAAATISRHTRLHLEIPISTVHCHNCSRCYIDKECEKRNAKREGQPSSNEEDIVLIKSPRKQP
eukprot:scaffold1446_cov77-Skeletonema_marinoi.AAC.3